MVTYCGGMLLADDVSPALAPAFGTCEESLGWERSSISGVGVEGKTLGSVR